MIGQQPPERGGLTPSPRTIAVLSGSAVRGEGEVARILISQGSREVVSYDLSTLGYRSAAPNGALQGTRAPARDLSLELLLAEFINTFGLETTFLQILFRKTRFCGADFPLLQH
jgi:hypothetical protein